MKALVLCSGGLDSSTCLAIAIKKYGKDNVVALTIYYGQKHSKEIKAAHNICKYYGVKQLKLDFSNIFANSRCSLLSSSNEDIPEKSYAEQLKNSNGKPVSTYVPFRNGLFLSGAAAVALSNDCDVLYYGAHADDAAGSAYPDCSIDFYNAINKAIIEGTGNQLSVEAPFIALSKADVVKKGIDLKVPYELTWSCYNGLDKPCGKCGTCIDRKRAFELNGIKDPLLEE